MIPGWGFWRRKSMAPVPVRTQSFLSVVRESFTGAWQRNVEVDTRQNILAFSAVYACIALISGDVAKLRPKLVEQDSDAVWSEIMAGSPFLPVIRKPNRWQTRVQFYSLWMVSKLIHGNTYVLKERDQRGIVVALYILDPKLVVPMVTDSGDVYYQLNRDMLSGVMESVTVPASEIIHDRGVCLWHPLVGVSPIYACGASATQGIRIQANSAKFFENMSRPSGQLTSPNKISDETAERLKKDFEERFSGSNIGRLLVTGDGLKYEAMTIPPVDAQMVEQLGWTAKDVGRAFGVPPYKLGLEQPTLNNVGALNMDYYSQCLQTHIEAIENLLDEGLGLVDVPGKTMGVEFDLDGLLRMDPLSRAETAAKLVGAALLAPNEGRLKENLPPVTGGDSPMIQQQNYSLVALAKRDSKADPFASNAPALPAPKPDAPPDASPKEFADTLIKRLTEETRDVV